MPLLNGARTYQRYNYQDKIYYQANKIGENDILFCIRATIGNIHFSDTQYCLGRGVAALRPQEDYNFSFMHF